MRNRPPRIRHLRLAAGRHALVAAWALALTGGCAGGSGQGGSAGDALVGSTGATGSTPGAGGGLTGTTGGSPTGSTGGTVPLPGEDCEPETVLGLCHVCTADGRPALPADDPACPPLDCAAFDVYARRDDGGVIRCTHRPAAPPPGFARCTAPGQCVTVATREICVVAPAPEPAPEAAPDAGPFAPDAGPFAPDAGPAPPQPETLVVDAVCASVTGCAGSAPPNVMFAPEGTPCNGAGTCDATGRCSVPAACARFGEHPFCASAEVGEETECEFWVAAPAGEKTTCRAFCEGAGACCVDAWPDTAPESCEHGGASNCTDEHGDLVCRCVTRDGLDPGAPCAEPGGFDL